MSQEQSIIRPSVNMLPLDEIEKALENKIVASDTRSVNGVPSTSIAISTSPDRRSVHNALNLDGIPASQYLTKDDDPMGRIVALGKDYEREVTNLRLELYRMYEILNKQLGASYVPQNGFLELFSKVVESSTVAQVVNLGNVVSELRPNEYHFAKEKEFVIVEANYNNNGVLEKQFYVSRIRTADPQHQTYLLDGDINSADTEVTLHKIKGEFLKNSFSFSHTEINTLSDKTHTVLLGDYDEFAKHRIELGFGTSVQIRSDMLTVDGIVDRAILDGVRVYIERSSLASSTQLSCKIYTINSTILDLTLIGESTYQDIETSGWVVFNIKKDGLPIEVTNTMKLLIAFECNGQNVYSIGVGKGQNSGDLHTNRSLYVKIDADGNTYYEPYLTDEYDILLGLIFKAYTPQTTTPFTSGLYTSSWFVNEKPNNRLLKAHIKLKNIRKAFVQSVDAVDSYNGFLVSNILNGTGTIIVGNNVLTCDRINNHTIHTKEHAAVYNGDIAYFMPCFIQVTACSELFDENDVSEVIELYCTGVTGDYLLFECILPNFTKRYQLQVKYEDINNVQAAALESIGASII